MSNIPPSTQPYRRQRSVGVWRKFQAVCLHPVGFFRALASERQSRSWLWAAILILLVSGVSAVRQDAVLSGVENAAFSDQLVTGLVIAGRMIIGWGVQMLLLALVPMLGQRAPDFGENLRVVVWASVPFGVLALVQIGYLALGESIGGAGMTPVLEDIPNYSEFDARLRYMLENIATHLTVFSLWHLALLYLGARHTLSGSRWAVGICIGCWVLSVALVPPLITMWNNPPAESTPSRSLSP